MAKPLLEDKQRMAKLIALGGAIATFVVVYNFFAIFSMNAFLGFILAIPSAFFAFNYIPIHWLGRKDPRITSPKEQAYTLGPDSILGRLTKVFKTLRVEGKRWHLVDQDPKTHTLVFNLEFKEELPKKDGVDIIENELILTIHAYQYPQSTEVSFLNLRYEEGSERVSITANEIMKQSTEAIYNDLQNYQMRLESN